MKIEHEGERSSSNAGESGHLQKVRERIDQVDAALVGLIRDRVSLAVAAAEAKEPGSRNLRDVAREAEVIRRAGERARTLGVDDEPVRDLFWRLIDLSHRTIRAPRPTHAGGGE